MNEKSDKQGNQVNISGNNNNIGSINQSTSAKGQSTKKETISVLEKRVYEMVSENELEQAILLVKSNSSKPEIKNSCTMLLRRLYSVKMNNIEGIVSTEQSNQEFNNIAKSILTIVNLIKEE
ncbi:MAG: hypothetical protein R2828_01480 [Saprospiraceae bacterium]